MFAVHNVKDLGTVNIYVDVRSTKHSRSKMHIWVTPAEAWHFYWVPYFTKNEWLLLDVCKDCKCCG